MTVRILLYVVVFYCLYRLVRSFLKGSISGGQRPEQPTADNAELEQDPQCGTYFLRRLGVRAVVRGKELYFCSEKCRDEYLRRSS